MSGRKNRINQIAEEMNDLAPRLNPNVQNPLKQERLGLFKKEGEGSGPKEFKIQRHQVDGWERDAGKLKDNGYNRPVKQWDVPNAVAAGNCVKDQLRKEGLADVRYNVLRIDPERAARSVNTDRLVGVFDNQLGRNELNSLADELGDFRD